MALVELGQTGRPEFSPRHGHWRRHSEQVWLLDADAASAIIDARDFAARREGEEQFDSP
jgi:hypothetical protein